MGRRKRDGKESNNVELCQILPPRTKALIGAITSWNIIMKNDDAPSMDSQIVLCPGSIEELVVNESVELIR